QGRPRSDEAHLASKHVRQLRQLVQARPSQESTDIGDAWVIGDLECAALDLVSMLKARETGLCIAGHRAELDHLERSAMEAESLLAEEHRPAVVTEDRDGDRCEDR